MPVCEEIIEDIEDLISSQDITPKERYSSKRKVTVRAKKKATEDDAAGKIDIRDNINTCNVNEDNKSTTLTSIIPGTQKIYIKTWGCTHNSSDSEYMAGQLAAYGYQLTQDKLLADLWLLNSCTVKNPAEDHFRNEVNEGRKLGKYIVAAGCVPQGSPRSSYLSSLSTIGVHQIDRIVEVVEETLKGHTIKLLKAKKPNEKAQLNLPKIRKNPLIEIIAINTGCLNQCSYCKTKYSRGQLGSYNPEDIVNRAVESFDEGVVELWLTSEDTGAYGLDIDYNLPLLMKDLLKVIPDNCMVRIGMTNPPYILYHLEDISAILNHPKVYSFIHIPVQSGSDKVLYDMKREYGIKDFQYIVDYLKERVHNLHVATDIICGYPTEDDEDFEMTVKLCDKYKFNSLFINQFYPRPGTLAAKLKKLDTKILKARTRQLSALFNSYKLYDDQINTIQKVLITELSTDKNYLVGHNKSYQQVLIEKDEKLIGKIVKVKIVETSKFFMKAVVVGDDVAVDKGFDMGFDRSLDDIKNEIKISKESDERFNSELTEADQQSINNIHEEFLQIMDKKINEIEEQNSEVDRLNGKEKESNKKTVQKSHNQPHEPFCNNSCATREMDNITDKEFNNQLVERDKHSLDETVGANTNFGDKECIEIENNQVNDKVNDQEKLINHFEMRLNDKLCNDNKKLDDDIPKVNEELDNKHYGSDKKVNRRFDQAADIKIPKCDEDLDTNDERVKELDKKLQEQLKGKYQYQIINNSIIKLDNGTQKRVHLKLDEHSDEKWDKESDVKLEEGSKETLWKQLRQFVFDVRKESIAFLVIFLAVIARIIYRFFAL